MRVHLKLSSYSGTSSDFQIDISGVASVHPFFFFFLIIVFLICLRSIPSPFLLDRLIESSMSSSACAEFWKDQVNSDVSIGQDQVSRATQKIVIRGSFPIQMFPFLSL